MSSTGRPRDLTERNASTIILIGTVIIVISCFLFGAIFGAHAHEASSGMVYGYDCCGGEHCHPVKDGVVNDTADGGVDVKGYGHLTKNDTKLRESQDTEDHVCDYQNAFGANTLYCVYHVRRGY